MHTYTDTWPCELLGNAIQRCSYPLVPTVSTLPTQLQTTHSHVLWNMCTLHNFFTLHHCCSHHCVFSSTTTAATGYRRVCELSYRDAVSPSPHQLSLWNGPHTWLCGLPWVGHDIEGERVCVSGSPLHYRISTTLVLYRNTCSVWQW